MARFTTWADDVPGGVGEGVGRAVGAGAGVVGSAEVALGDGEFAEGDGDADGDGRGDGVGGTVAVTVTGGGGGVAAAGSCLRGRSGASRRTRSGIRATPRAAEVSRARRPAGQVTSGRTAGGPAGGRRLLGAQVCRAVPGQQALHQGLPGCVPQGPQVLVGGRAVRAVRPVGVQVGAAARAVRPYRLLDQPAEVGAARVVGGGQTQAQAGPGQGGEGLRGAVRHVRAAQAEEGGGALLRLLFHHAVPEQALGAGGQRAERREEGRHGAVGQAGGVPYEQQAGVDARGALVVRPGRRQPGGQQQEAVAQRDGRVDAACRLAGRRGEGLGRQPAGGGLARRAQPGVGQDRRVVPSAQFLQRGVRRGGGGAEQFGEARVRGVCQVPVRHGLFRRGPFRHAAFRYGPVRPGPARRVLGAVP
ncbi:hypothetical protein ACQ4WX_21155 [Streptomyces lasalocidi]